VGSAAAQKPRKVRSARAATHCNTASQSKAATFDAVIAELRASRWSERAGRLIDMDETSSIERKKREGYL